MTDPIRYADELSRARSEERLYTAEEVEEAVERRLSRERKKNASLKAMREIVNRLRRLDGYASLSNAQIADKMASLLSKETCSPEKTDEASLTDDPSESALPSSVLPSEEPTPPSARTPSGTDEYTIASAPVPVSPMPVPSSVGFPQIPSEMPDAAEAFRAYCTGRPGSLSELAEGFAALARLLSPTEGGTRIASPGDTGHRRTLSLLGSTAFSGGVHAGDGGFNLSENQRRLADASGLSYRQYAELLAQIPSKNHL